VINGTKSLPSNVSRPSSLPPSGRATPDVRLSSEKKLVSHNADKPVFATTSAPADQEAEDVFEAWGAMDEEEDSFFDAPSTRKRSPSPKPAKKFDDGGEPDFAGWLAAQSQAKSKKPLPKGMTKSSQPRRILADRTTSTGTMGSGAGAQKLLSTTKPKVTVPVKRLDTKPKEVESADDGWGDDWG
jgi:SCY1-like protein 1